MADDARRPNLVLVDCHDLGRHLACYGQATVPSDALDAFAQGGVLFEQAFCTAPQCSPSRAALYTGRHAHHVGMLGLAHPPFDWRLHPDARHLASILRDAGWKTAHFGVQHVIRDTPEHVRSLGFAHHAASHTDAATTAAAAVDFVRDAAAPYFLNVGFLEPHRDRRGRFLDQPPRSERGVAVPPYLPDGPEAREEMAQVQGAIAAMAEGFGRVLAAIDARDDAADTWVIFTTDHGLAMPRAKATMYDAGIGVALIMRWPARGVTGGRRSRALVSHVDLVPTVLEGLGLTPPEGLHGRSYWPLLLGEADAHRRAVFAEKTFHTAYEPMRAVRTERHKLIANLEVDIMNVPGDVLRSPITPRMIDEIVRERPPLELYDLLEDPHERVNRIADPALAAVADELRRELVAWMRATDDPILRGPVPSPYRHAAMAALGLPEATAPYPDGPGSEAPT
jgi:N-sulfoglucosamine sulfohydrolase